MDNNKLVAQLKQKIRALQRQVAHTAEYGAQRIQAAASDDNQDDYPKSPTGDDEDMNPQHNHHGSDDRDTFDQLQNNDGAV